MYLLCIVQSFLPNMLSRMIEPRFVLKSDYTFYGVLLLYSFLDNFNIFLSFLIDYLFLFLLSLWWQGGIYFFWWASADAERWSTENAQVQTWSKVVSSLEEDLKLIFSECEPGWYVWEFWMVCFIYHCGLFLKMVQKWKTLDCAEDLEHLNRNFLAHSSFLWALHSCIQLWNVAHWLETLPSLVFVLFL